MSWVVSCAVIEGVFKRAGQGRWGEHQGADWELREMSVRTCVLTPFPPTPVKSQPLCIPLILAFSSQYVSGDLRRTSLVYSVPAPPGLPFDLEQLCLPPCPVTRLPSMRITSLSLRPSTDGCASKISPLCP